MDCRRSVLVALLLALGACGCVDPWARQEVVAPKTPPVPPAHAVKRTAEKEKPKRAPRPETSVALASAWKNQAASAEQNPSAQMQLREQSRRAYQEALKADPGYMPALVGLAQLYTQMEDYERALDTYHRAIQKYPKESVLYYDLGMCLARRKDFAQATVHMKKALEIEPENLQYAQGLGFILARAGRIDESLALLTRTQGRAQAHYNVARMLLHLQQQEQGRHHLTLALQVNPQLEPARQLLAHLDHNGGRSVEIHFDSDAAQPAGGQ